MPCRARRHSPFVIPWGQSPAHAWAHVDCTAAEGVLDDRFGGPRCRRRASEEDSVRKSEVRRGLEALAGARSPRSAAHRTRAIGTPCVRILASTHRHRVWPPHRRHGNTGRPARSTLQIAPQALPRQLRRDAITRFVRPHAGGPEDARVGPRRSLPFVAGLRRHRGAVRWSLHGRCCARSRAARRRDSRRGVAAAAACAARRSAFCTPGTSRDPPASQRRRRHAVGLPSGAIEGAALHATALGRELGQCTNLVGVFRIGRYSELGRPVLSAVGAGRHAGS